MDERSASLSDVVDFANYRARQFVSQELTPLIDVARQLLLEWGAVDLAACAPAERVEVLNSYIELKLVIAAFDKVVLDEAAEMTDRLERSLTRDEIVALVRQRNPEALRVTLA